LTLSALLQLCDVNVNVGCVTSAKEAGITIVNEVGVDPGIDHMLAMQCFDDVKIRSGKVILACYY